MRDITHWEYQETNPIRETYQRSWENVIQTCLLPRDTSEIKNKYYKDSAYKRPTYTNIKDLLTQM